MCDTDTICGTVGLRGFGVADICGMPTLGLVRGQGTGLIELGDRSGERAEVIESIITSIKRGWRKTDGTSLSKLITLWGDEGDTIAVVHLVLGTLPLTQDIGCSIPQYSGTCTPEILRINALRAMHGLPSNEITIPLHITSDPATYSDANWMCGICLCLEYLQEWDYSICVDTGIGGILAKEVEFPDLSNVPFPLRNHASESALINGVLKRKPDTLVRDTINYLAIVKERIGGSAQEQLLCLKLLSCEAFPSEHVATFIEDVSSVILSSEDPVVLDHCLAILSKCVDAEGMSITLPSLSKTATHQTLAGPLRVTSARIFGSVIAKNFEGGGVPLIEKTLTKLLAAPRSNTTIHCLSLIVEGLLDRDVDISGLGEFFKFGWKSATSGDINYNPLAKVLLSSLSLPQQARYVPDSRIPTALIHIMKNCGTLQPAIALTSLNCLFDGYHQTPKARFSEHLSGSEVTTLVDDFIKPCLDKLLGDENSKTTGKKKKKKSGDSGHKTITHSSLFTKEMATQMLQMAADVIYLAGGKHLSSMELSAAEFEKLRDGFLMSDPPAVSQLLRLLKLLSCDHYNPFIASTLTNNLIQLSLDDVEHCSMLSDLLLAVFDCKNSLFSQNSPGPSSQPAHFTDSNGAPLNGITLMSLRYQFEVPAKAITGLLKWSAPKVQKSLFDYYHKMLINCIIDKSPLDAEHEACLSDILTHTISLAIATEIHSSNVYAMQLLANIVKYFNFFRREELGIESKIRKLVDKHPGIITGIGKFSTAKGMKSTSADDVRHSVLSAIIYSIKLLPWGVGWYCLDQKLLKKLLFIHEKHPVCRPLVEEFISLLATSSSQTPKDISKVSEYFMPLALSIGDLRLIILMGQCKIGLNILYDNDEKGDVYRRLQASFVDRSQPDLLDETTKLINDLLEEQKTRQASAVEEQKRALARLDAQLHQEEEELAAVKKAREAEALYHEKKQQEAEELFNEIQKKIELQNAAVEKEENRKRSEGTQRVRAAQREERKKRTIEMESRKLQEAERRSREYSLMQEHKTLHELHSIGIPQFKARAAMLHNNNTTDCDMLIEWLVQYGDEIVNNKSHPSGVAGVRVTGTGAVQVIKQPETNSTTSKNVIPKVNVMEVPKTEMKPCIEDNNNNNNDDDDDDYQDFWAVDVDVTKNVKLIANEETQNYETNQPNDDDDDDDDDTSDSDSTETDEKPAGNIHGNEHSQHSDYRRLFQLKFDNLASSHPLAESRKKFPTWHAQMAPILDLFDFNQNTRTRLSDVRYFSQQDLGFKWFNHIGSGFGNLRSYLEWLQKKGLVAFKQNSKKDPCAVDFIVLTRFGMRYHKQYWDRSTSVVHRKPIEDERRETIRKQREEELAAARKMALSALLKMKAERDAKELPDPESFVLPDWFIEEEVQEQTDKNRLNQKEIEQLQARAREKRLKRLLRTHTKPAPPRPKAKKAAAVKPQKQQPAQSQAEIAAEQRRQAAERAEQRKQAAIESERRSAIATRNTIAGWKRIRRKQTPKSLKLFFFAVAAFWVYMIAAHTSLLQYVTRTYGPPFQEHILSPLASYYYDLSQ
eukprot:TRINITY_DN10867_c1_g1_i6.p1 TRINITY_DN10867_c1_g1~~TRINITY_DN10867_c1_g1_i6.p1  ORF type:complete len:1558 (+),score=390.10 TRINITY_DN10867_c1_g1_i6:42-4715(+)